ncbi:MAG TPA: hypothetical protein VFL61_01215 [Gaiellaceae bacterium]|nr:hypothetical protein [Gaiellaceae bacterium]
MDHTPGFATSDSSPSASIRFPMRFDSGVTRRSGSPLPIVRAETNWRTSAPPIQAIAAPMWTNLRSS